MIGSSCLVLVDSPAPHVARVLINRPEKRNAIDAEVRQALIDALTAVLAQPDHRALVFGGIAATFSAGGDVPSMIGLSEVQARERMRHGHVLCRLIGNARIPVVTAIEGFGAGAAVGLALLGDFIVVGEGSKILFPFMKLGLTPDWGTLYSLPRRVGMPCAMNLLTSGQMINGAEALSLGIADQLAADGQVMNAAIARAAELAKLPAGAFARMKQRLVNSSTSLEQELLREEHDQTACLLGEEFSEGYGAFMEKRAADFLMLPKKRD